MEVTLVDKMGTDLSVVNAARVSYSKESKTFVLQDEKLIKYLAEHKHWSPFAHASLQFRIKAPIFVARQLVKHQVGLVWNEVSRRYVDHAPELYKPDSWRGRPQNSKQGSDGEVKLDQTIRTQHGDHDGELSYTVQQSVAERCGTRAGTYGVTAEHDD